MFLPPLSSLPGFDPQASSAISITARVSLPMTFSFLLGTAPPITGFLALSDSWIEPCLVTDFSGPNREGFVLQFHSPMLIF